VSPYVCAAKAKEEADRHSLTLRTLFDLRICRGNKDGMKLKQLDAYFPIMQDFVARIMIALVT